MSVKIAVPLAAMAAAVLLLTACFGGGDKASAPGTASKPGASTPTSTIAPVTVTATEPDTVPTTTEPVTVTGLADVPTTTEKVGTDVLPKSAPPWHEELSACKTHNVRLLYDRDIPAILVMQGDEVLAWAGLYRRDVSDECRDVPRKRHPSVSSEQPEGIYESVELRCNSQGRIQIDTRAVESHGSVDGSIVVVGVAGTTDWLISAIAVNEVEGGRVYVNPRSKLGACTSTTAGSGS